MPSHTTVSARVDERTKREAAEILRDLGLSVSDAIRMLFVRIAAEKALPSELKTPNPATVQALDQIEQRKGKRFDNPAALFKDLGI